MSDGVTKRLKQAQYIEINKRLQKLEAMGGGYDEGYEQGRADELERCIQAVNQVPIIERGYEYSEGLNAAIEAIRKSENIGG